MECAQKKTNGTSQPRRTTATTQPQKQNPTCPTGVYVLLLPNCLVLTRTLTTVCASNNCRKLFPWEKVAPLAPMERSGFLAYRHTFSMGDKFCCRSDCTASLKSISKSASSITSSNGPWLSSSWLVVLKRPCVGTFVIECVVVVLGNQDEVNLTWKDATWKLFESECCRTIMKESVEENPMVLDWIGNCGVLLVTCVASQGKSLGSR